MQNAQQTISYNETNLPRWDLADLYPGIQSKPLADDIETLKAEVQSFCDAYATRVAALKAEELGAAIQAYEKIEDLAGRIGSYAQLIYAEDMNNPEHGQFYQNMQEILTDIGAKTLFFTLHINRIEDEVMERFYQESATVKHYAPWLREIRQMRPYQLADDIEKLLHEKSVAGRSAWSRMFDETLAGLEFPFEKQKLTCEEILDKLSSTDGAVRKKAAKSFGKVLGENNAHFALITNTLAKDKSIEDNWRGFSRPIESRNMVNAVENEVVDALLTSVKGAYPTLSHRYYKLKAGWFGKKKLPYWDRNAPLPGAAERIFNWHEATAIVLESYAAFSPELAKIGQKFFDHNWIDVPSRPGKASGAFAHPTVPSAHPYLLLNYLGKSRDVMTLAHELGHGVHQVLAAEQGALMADTPLTLAETASVFGEQLTFRALLANAKNDAERKALLASKVEDMLNTVVRQIAFCEFEIRLHDARKQGELLAEEINHIWQEVQAESLGPAITYGPEYRYFWSYIPHFIHTPFYVYAYAFGDCLVNSLYAVYQQEKAAGKADVFVERYMAMLKAGGSLRHKELLAPFGLDASKADFWQQGLGIISSMIDELEAME